MSGILSFHFDDAHLSHYEQAFPVFQKAGVPGCLACPANPNALTFSQLQQMQAAGWEILSHSVNHIHMKDPLPHETAIEEIATSKALLEAHGLHIRQFVTPMSVCHDSMRPLLQEHYDAAFTRYTSSATTPIEDMVIQRPVNRYALNRCCLSGKTLEELKAYVDYVCQNDAWLIFYEHDIGSGQNITAENLQALIAYSQEKGVEILTSSQALDRENCRTKIIQEGYDGKNCYVHARMAVHDQDILITAQMMDVSGSDCFEVLQSNFSRDGGKTWTGFRPDIAFSSWYHDGMRSVCSDMTPMFHKKTGTFLATGHTVDYDIGSVFPVNDLRRRCATPYAVFDPETGKFRPQKFVEMPDPVKYCDCGSGCSQCYELENGDILIPVSFSEKIDGVAQDAKVTVMRCAFDGEELKLLELGNELEVADEVRGIGEASVIFHDNKFYCTIRGDTYGYVSVSDDGLHYTQPQIWKWDDGEILPTYNTQSHWLHCGGKLYLVYTRKNGSNDHVFRHRAPLYVGQVDCEKLAIIRDSEFVAVPERGARLGNFGVVSPTEETGYVVVTEWMQPAGCEAYGSANALWLTDITVR